MDFDKILESIKTVKLTGGIFGKTNLLLIVLCLCVAAVAFEGNIWWMKLALMLPLMFIVAYAIKRCFDFAEKNPQAAIMDGAEFLIHERIMHGQKGLDSLAQLPPTIDHEMPLLETTEVEENDSPPVLVLSATNSKNIEGVK